MVCLFKKKEITTAYLVESKEQTVKNQGPLLNATLAVIVLEMIHVLIVTRVKKRERRVLKRIQLQWLKTFSKSVPRETKLPIFITQLDSAGPHSKHIFSH